MDRIASLKTAIDQIKASLRSPEEYRKILRRLDQLPRRRGRPRKRRLSSGGSSRSDSDLLIMTALQAGRTRVKEICDYSRLPQSRAYRGLSRLVTQGLVAKRGWPHEWTLVEDREKVAKYELAKLRGLKWTRHSNLRDLRRRLKLGLCLAEGGDETIELYLRHPESFLRKERELRSFRRFVDEESKQKTTPYLDRIAEQRHYGRLLRSRKP